MTNIDINYQNPDYYKELDILKCVLYEDSNYPINLMERNYISTLAHTYAKSKFENSENIYNSMLNWYKSHINKNLLKPDLYIYLDLPDTLIIDRLNKRNQSNVLNKNWIDTDYINLTKQYYEEFFGKIEPDIPIVKIDAKPDFNDVITKIKHTLTDFRMY